MFQISATVAASGALALCLIFVLQEILPALLWAGVLYIALWPGYARFHDWRASRLWRCMGAPMLFTALVGLIVAAPVALAALEVAREARDAMGWIEGARHSGVPLPAVISQLPWVGLRMAAWWQSNLSNPSDATNLFREVGPAQLMGLTRSLGAEILHRILLFVVTLTTLFFLFREGRSLRTSFLKLGETIFGARGAPIGHHVVEAIHGTVDGLVLVGLAEGAVIGAGYWVTGVPHAFAFAIATSVLAIIPFGAPLAFCFAAIFLLGIGRMMSALFLVGFGFLVVFVTDHIVRPILIGGASRIPFLLVLLGILGGISSLGLVGLFVGPALMAMLMTIWRDIAKYNRA